MKCTLYQESVMNEILNTLSTLLLLAAPLICISQPSVNGTNYDFPFQVLCSDGALTPNGDEVKNLEILDKDMTIQLDSAGFFSIVHYTGYAFEFIGDTTFNIGEFNEHVMSVQSQVGHENISNWPSMEYLFITDGVSARRNILYSTGACHDCNENFLISYPPQFNAKRPLLYSGDLCFGWNKTTSGPYIVKVFDLKQKHVLQYNTDHPFIIIPQSELDKIKAKYKLVQIFDANNEIYSEPVLIKHFQSPLVRMNFACLSLHLC